MSIRGFRWVGWIAALLMFLLYGLTAPQNHSEAEDVYDFALQVEQGSFGDQAGVNRVLALPIFGVTYKTAQAIGYSGRAFPFMIFMNRILAVVCLFLFWRMLSLAAGGIEANAPPDKEAEPLITTFFGSSQHSSMIIHQLFPTLGIAFSYGFWRYVNEAETYILASLFVLGAWCLVLKGEGLGARSWVLGSKGDRRSGVRDQVSGSSGEDGSVDEKNPCLTFVLRPQASVLRPPTSVLCPLISAIGILVHLLNVVPLLLIIPLYYLLSKQWKRALIHGTLTGMLVVFGYVICSPWLDFSELGGQHHALEGGIGLGNCLRGGVAFGQNLIAANFLFGFESFRELLTGLFPSRMLDEEFFMALKMARWIPWAGVVTLLLLVVSSVWALLGIIIAGYRCKGACCAEEKNADGVTEYEGSWIKKLWCRGKLSAVRCPLISSILTWFLLYALAVIRTEAGSPELWIMALIPFWLLIALFLKGSLQAGNPSSKSERRLKAVSCLLIAILFLHNFIAGLLPVMSEGSDYHVQKGAWVVENTNEDDLILTSYEPVMIFYLNYFSPAEIVSSADYSLNQITRKLDHASGQTYALYTFFSPIDSMRYRYPVLYENMREIGQRLAPEFDEVAEDQFGGVFRRIKE